MTCGPVTVQLFSDLCPPKPRYIVIDYLTLYRRTAKVKIYRESEEASLAESERGLAKNPQ
jgi:hypothetical protein